MERETNKRGKASREENCIQVDYFFGGGEDQRGRAETRTMQVSWKSQRFVFQVPLGTHKQNTKARDTLCCFFSGSGTEGWVAAASSGFRHGASVLTIVTNKSWGKACSSVVQSAHFLMQKPASPGRAERRPT